MATNTQMKLGLSILALTVNLLYLVPAAQAAPVSLTGAGATFPYPLYSKWISDYQRKQPDAKINYQSIGSGGGIRQFTEGTVDFGASDAPMTDEQLSKVKAGVIHVPTALGAVALSYNLPGVPSGLKLTPEILADIFLGRIPRWNDARIAKANVGVSLPNLPVLTVHRSDGSGTSAIFTDYLSKVSVDWKSKVGTGTAVSWPTGLGGKGNEGVAGLVKQTPGAMGYLELVYADRNAMSVVSLRNRAGTYVVPTPASITAAGASFASTMPKDFRISITDPSGKGAYPISGFTYLLVPAQGPVGAKGKVLKEFIVWALTVGQAGASALTYAPLPKSVAAQAVAKVRTIRTE